MVGRSVVRFNVRRHWRRGGRQQPLETLGTGHVGTGRLGRFNQYPGALSLECRDARGSAGEPVVEQPIEVQPLEEILHALPAVGTEDFCFGHQDSRVAAPPVPLAHCAHPPERFFHLIHVSIVAAASGVSSVPKVPSTSPAGSQERYLPPAQDEHGLVHLPGTPRGSRQPPARSLAGGGDAASRELLKTWTGMVSEKVMATMRSRRFPGR